MDDKTPLYIRIERIVEVFKQLSEFKGNIGSESTLNTNQKVKTELPEEKFMKEFTNFLINNRIKFTDLFNTKSDTISHDVLKNACAMINFQYNSEDFNKLLLYLDSYNKGTINIVAIKKMITNYCPDYFEKPFQKIDKTAIKNENSLSKASIKEPAMKIIIDQINLYIDKNKITIVEYFNKVQKMNQKFLNLIEFTQLIKTTITTVEEKVNTNLIFRILKFCFYF